LASAQEENLGSGVRADGEAEGDAVTEAEGLGEAVATGVGVEVTLGDGASVTTGLGVLEFEGEAVGEAEGVETVGWDPMETLAGIGIAALAPQLASFELRASCSPGSIDKSQRYLTAIHDPMYLHTLPEYVGSQLAGSRSPLDRFELADTATRAKLIDKSLANASLDVGVQLLAPDLQASASGTRWSTSSFDPTLITELS
jgi:hypothetical protein